MCDHAEQCAFYIKHRHTRSRRVKSLLRHYCEEPEGCQRCRRLLINQYFDVDLSSAIGPAGDYLEYH